MSSSTRLLLFDPNSGGHHAGYIAHVLWAWRKLALSGRIVAAVSPRLFDEHPQLRDLAYDDGRGAAEFVEMPEAESLPKDSLLRKGLAERRLLKHYVERLRPAHAIAMFADHTQFALASGLRFSHPVEVSLLFLRISHHRPPRGPEPLRAKLTRLRKRIVLRAVLANPHFGTAFSADPPAVAAVHALKPTARAFALPDPVPLPSHPAPVEQTRRAYGVEPNRKLLLLFGVQAERKGVFKTLDAVRQLPDALAGQICILMAGPVEASLRPTLSDAIDATRRNRPVQIILHDTYLHEQAISDVMAASDLVLVPYQLHAGTSSVLIRAAGARRPVLSQDYGLMGEQVRDHALGQCIDARRPEAIAEGIHRFLHDPLTGFDPERARAFAETQTPEAYAYTLFAHLGLLPADASLV